MLNNSFWTIAACVAIIHLIVYWYHRAGKLREHHKFVREHKLIMPSELLRLINLHTDGKPLQYRESSCTRTSQSWHIYLPDLYIAYFEYRHRCPREDVHHCQYHTEGRSTAFIHRKGCATWALQLRDGHFQIPTYRWQLCPEAKCPDLPSAENDALIQIFELAAGAKRAPLPSPTSPNEQEGAASWSATRSDNAA